MSKYIRKTDITCLICGYKCGNGYLYKHLKDYHNMNKAEYLNLFPDGKFYTDEFLQKRSKAVSNEMYKRWKNNEYRDKMISVLTDNAHNEEFRNKLIKSVTGNKYGPRSDEFKQAHSILMQKKWKTKKYRNNWYRGYMSSNKRFRSPKTKQKLSKSTTNLWGIAEYREKVLDRAGNNHSRHFKYINRHNNILNLMSLQELRVAYLLDLCNLKYLYGGGSIQCFNYILNNNKHTYTPDFQIYDTFIEVKPNGWQIKEDTWKKLELIQLQNNIVLYVYDDNYIDDYMPKISRNMFLYYANKCCKNTNELNYLDLYNMIGDVRNENFIQ